MTFIILIIYFLIRLYPYFLSPVPLGYDPGLYLYLWHHSLSIPWLQTIYPPLIFWLGKLLSFLVTPEQFLIPLSFIIAGVLFWSVYLYSKNRWTIFLLTISAIQYRFWWYYYIKNILATSFIFFYLYFDRKKSGVKYIFAALIPLLHQPTAIILFMILVLKKRLRSILLFLVAFAIYYLPNYELTVKPFLGGVSSTINAASGTFYDLPQALGLMLPYLPLSIYGIYWSLKRRTNKLMVVMMVISFLIPALGLFLSRRFIPFFDLFAIVLAGYGAREFFSKHHKLAVGYVLALIIFSGIYVVKNSRALILPDEFEEIKLLETTPSDAYILVTDNEYTPWMYGYSKRQPITPGFGEYDTYWTDPEWQKFWLSGDHNLELELLKKLPQPLYVWKGDRNYPTKFSMDGNCFERFSWHTFKFLCGSKL